MARKEFGPYSGVDSFLEDLANWVSEDEAKRLATYTKYDEIYWNDPTQFKIRVLENEDPVYVPNAMRVVNTTSHYLLKGLTIPDPKPNKNEEEDSFFTAWMKREAFYSKLHLNKQAGVTRGDWAFHITADPDKDQGERVSLTALHPGLAIRVPDPDDADRIIRVHLVDTVRDEQQNRTLVKKLTYEKEDGRIYREEALWDLQNKWWTKEGKKVKTLIQREALPDDIDQIPVFWLRNIPWQGQLYGSSELRGFEYLMKAATQAATDTQAALALEGLGVYATDGGRPVDENGKETEFWEVSPGQVMEVPAGSWFRRVEGVGSITPMQAQIAYIEEKMFKASGLSDVALGQIDIQTAQSGIALAIQFLPTLAKLEQRDQEGLEVLDQLFFNLRKWWDVYDNETVEILEPHLGPKLPTDRKEAVNELNNMFDRRIISRKYFRKKMEELGYKFPPDEEMEKDILKDIELLQPANILGQPSRQLSQAEDAGASPTGSGEGGTEGQIEGYIRNEGQPNETFVRPHVRLADRTRINESNGTEA